MGNSFGKAVIGAAFVVSAATVSAGDARALCYTASEHRAAIIRQMHSDFMVAALQCRNRPDLALTTEFNHYVRRFNADLVVNAEVLQGHFRRHHGGRYLAKFDDFVTGLANDGAIRSVREKGFCETQREALHQVLSASGNGLDEVAARTPLRGAEVADCGDAVPVKTAGRKSARGDLAEARHSAP